MQNLLTYGNYIKFKVQGAGEANAGMSATSADELHQLQPVPVRLQTLEVTALRQLC